MSMPFAIAADLFALSGMTSIPLERIEVRPTFQQIKAGEQNLRTMSCSCKILKWNTVGLQGSLLSQFVEPIYMSSLTLGKHLCNVVFMAFLYWKIVFFNFIQVQCCQWWSRDIFSRPTQTETMGVQTELSQDTYKNVVIRIKAKLSLSKSF